LGPSVETFLTVAVPVTAIVVALLYSFRKELGRIKRYVRTWKTQDEVEEHLTEAARREVEQDLGPDQQVDVTHG
jgi:hypothetical protein